ncbi:MAG: hypothetical protein H7A20_05555 [Rhodanobacteraceae bacterium]|nr:hypothetical protein [Xanthomonadales bacterium]MCP5478233.1 hypothetical protein [Rhodanobacteraceae bacterium]HPF72921.1 hypothetical protein [Xanthomonadaceae bacterium]HRX99982.1 hypothetical protein [Xanthomonadaceae bacterium]
MKRLFAASIAACLPLLTSAHTSHGPYDDHILWNGSELADWCYWQAVDQYSKKGFYTYQWTASHGSYGEQLYANGQLRVHGDDVPVSCTAAQQSWTNAANIKINDPELSNPHAKTDFDPAGG